jgi:hypothetical protein
MAATKGVPAASATSSGRVLGLVPPPEPLDPEGPSLALAEPSAPVAPSGAIEPSELVVPPDPEGPPSLAPAFQPVLLPASVPEPGAPPAPLASDPACPLSEAPQADTRDATARRETFTKGPCLCPSGVSFWSMSCKIPRRLYGPLLMSPRDRLWAHPVSGIRRPNPSLRAEAGCGTTLLRGRHGLAKTLTRAR